MAALSVQLYSIRDAVAADLPGALARLAALGVTQVEPFDVVGDPDGPARRAGRAGLSAPSVHARSAPAPSSTGSSRRPRRSGARDRGPPVHARASSGLRGGRRRRRRASWRAAADAARAYGLRVGYHNHHWELASRLGGRPALERLAERLPPGRSCSSSTRTGRRSAARTWWRCSGGSATACGCCTSRTGRSTRTTRPSCRWAPARCRWRTIVERGDGGRARGARVRRLRRRPVRGPRRRAARSRTAWACGERRGPVGVGVIGAGKISDQYLANMAAVPRPRRALRRRPAARASRGAQAERYGVPAAGTVEQALARDDVELVVNLTIPAAHARGRARPRSPPASTSATRSRSPSTWRPPRR